MDILRKMIDVTDNEIFKARLITWLTKRLNKYNCDNVQVYNLIFERDQNKVCAVGSCSYISDINGYIYHPTQIFVLDKGKWYSSLFDEI